MNKDKLDKIILVYSERARATKEKITDVFSQCNMSSEDVTQFMWYQGECANITSCALIEKSYDIDVHELDKLLTENSIKELKQSALLKDLASKGTTYKNTSKLKLNILAVEKIINFKAFTSLLEKYVIEVVLSSVDYSLLEE